jgi:hypothetical protein
MPWQDVCTVRARRDDQRIIPQENIKKIAYESDGSGSRILLYLDLSNKLTKGNGFIDYNMMELEVCEATWMGHARPRYSHKTEPIDSPLARVNEAVIVKYTRTVRATYVSEVQSDVVVGKRMVGPQYSVVHYSTS